MVEPGKSNIPSDELLLLSKGQREVMHEILAEGSYVDPMEAMAQAAANSADIEKIMREGEAATRIHVKPLWATLGLGIPGLLLLISQVWFEAWDRQFHLGLHDYLPWLRLFALLGGGVLLIAAWPAPMTGEKIELKTRRW
jgi:hypothetical protein